VWFNLDRSIYGDRPVSRPVLVSTPLKVGLVTFRISHRPYVLSRLFLHLFHLAQHTRVLVADNASGFSCTPTRAQVHHSLAEHITAWALQSWLRDTANGSLDHRRQRAKLLRSWLALQRAWYTAVPRPIVTVGASGDQEMCR
jgi:hypothetical protein